MKKTIWLGMVLLLLAAAMVSPAPAAQKKAGLPDVVIFVTSSMGSSAYGRAVAQCDLLQGKLGVTFTPEPTTGALAQGNLIKAGRALLMATNAYDIGSAFRGEGPYTRLGRIPIRTLQVGEDNPIGMLVRKDSGLKTVADLKGKRIAEFKTHPDSVIKVRAYLKANGLDPDKDVKYVPASSSEEGLEMVKMGRVEAVNVSVRGGKTKDFDVTVGGLFLSSAHDKKAVALAKSVNSGLNFVKVKAGSPAVPEDTYILSENTIFVIKTDAGDQLAYLIVKAMIENHGELAKKNKSFRGWNLKQAVAESPVPFHGGAVKYYKEKGAWGPEQEEMQKELLTMAK